MNAGLIAVGFVVLMVASTLWRAAVLSLLWWWFVVPVFKTLPLGLAQAAGLSLIVGFLTYQREYEKENETTMEIFASATGRAFLVPLFAVVMGYVIRWFL